MAFQLIDNFRKYRGGSKPKGMYLAMYGAKASAAFLSREAASLLSGQEYVCVLVDTDERKLYITPTHKGADGARKWNGESFAGAPLIKRALGIDSEGSIHVPVVSNGVGLYAQFPPAQG